MKINDALIERMNEFNAKSGWKPYRVSKESIIPQTTLSSIKYGRSKSIEVKTIYRFCEGYGITLKEFFDSPLFAKDNLELE
jgi:DNA-binding Xre family transcriptional regulator